MESSDLASEIRRFHRWVALGAIGTLLVGVGSLGTVYTYSKMFGAAKAAAACKSPTSQSNDAPAKDFGDTASELFETGKLDELSSKLEARKLERPNDGEVYWWYARLHFARNEIDEAKKDLNYVRVYSPGWNEEYVEPMLTAIEKLAKAN